MTVRDSPAQMLLALPPRRIAWLSVAILVLFYILSVADRQVIAFVVDPLKADLGISDLQVSLLQGLAFALLYVIAGLPFGYLVDRFEPRMVILGGVLIWSLTTVGCGLSTSFAWLFLFRIGVGIGEAALSPAAHVILVRSFPPDRLGLPMAIFMLSWQIGAAAAYVSGGYLISALSSQASYVVPLLGELRSWQIAFVALGLPGIALAQLAFALPRIRRPAACPTAAPEGEIGAFIRSRGPFLIRHFLGFGLIAMCANSLMLWGPVFYLRVWKLPAQQVGLIFGVIFLLGALGTLSLGWLADVLRRQGIMDSHVRVPMIATLIGAPCFGVGWLMDDLWLGILLVGIGSVLMNAWGGCGAASLQMVATPVLRGRVTAVWIAFNTIIGAAGGPLLVAWLTQFVFVDSAMVGKSMAALTAVAAPLAVLLLWSALPMLRRLSTQLQSAAPAVQVQR